VFCDSNGDQSLMPRAEALSLDLYDLVEVTQCELRLSEDAFRVRVELFRNRTKTSLYRASLWREELYRLQPTLPLKRGRPSHQPSDETIWVDWTAILRRCYQPFVARSSKNAQGLVLRDVEAWLRHTRAECGGDMLHTWAECAPRKSASQNKRMQLTRSAKAGRRGPRS
jgi:hypothetical protein